MGGRFGGEPDGGEGVEATGVGEAGEPETGEALGSLPGTAAEILDDEVRAKAGLLHNYGGSPIGNSRVKLTNEFSHVGQFATHRLPVTITCHVIEGSPRFSKLSYGIGNIVILLDKGIEDVTQTLAAIKQPTFGTFGHYGS